MDCALPADTSTSTRRVRRNLLEWLFANPWMAMTPPLLVPVVLLFY